MDGEVCDKAGFLSSKLVGVIANTYKIVVCNDGPSTLKIVEASLDGWVDRYKAGKARQENNYG